MPILLSLGMVAGFPLAMIQWRDVIVSERIFQVLYPSQMVDKIVGFLVSVK